MVRKMIAGRHRFGARRLLSCVVTLGLAVGLVFSTSASGTVTEGQIVRATSRLVVSADQGRSSANLFALSLSGRLRRLTSTRAHQTQPALSATGSEITYVQAASATCAPCSSSVWLVNAGGVDARQLTAPLPGTISSDSSPSWSPDGRQVVFCRQTNISNELYVVPASGGTPRSLFVQGVSPAWGPTRIAYLSPPTQAPGPVTLWTMNPDGSKPLKVTVAYAVSPAWSRSGSLAYLDQPPTARSTLVVISGGAFHRYPLPVSHATSLSWSPDGTRLAIVGHSTGATKADVYVVGVNGKGLRQLTKNAGATGVSWSA